MEDENLEANANCADARKKGTTDKKRNTIEYTKHGKGHELQTRNATSLFDLSIKFIN